MYPVVLLFNAFALFNGIKWNGNYGEKKKLNYVFLNRIFVHFRVIKCLVPEFNPCFVSRLFTGKKARVLKVYREGAGHHVLRHHVWCENALIKHFLFVTLIYQDSSPPVPLWAISPRFEPARQHTPPWTINNQKKMSVQVLFKPYLKHFLNNCVRISKSVCCVRFLFLL